jgi:hypothetical protein
MDEAKRLEDLFRYYADKWETDAMVSLTELAMLAIKADGPSDREVAQRVRALGLMLKTSSRVDRLLQAHKQREQEIREGSRKPPALPDLKPGDVPTRDFWPSEPPAAPGGLDR